MDGWGMACVFMEDIDVAWGCIVVSRCPGNAHPRWFVVVASAVYMD